MWIAKYKIWHKNCLLRPKCVKYNVTDLVYLLNSWKDKKNFFYTELHILQGTEESKKKFIMELKKEKTVKKLEQKGNYIFTLNVEPLQKQYYSPVFDPKLIQLKPVIQRSDGFEDWELGCWEKETLMKIMDVPVFETKLISIKNTFIEDIFVPRLFPKISPKQKEALEIAIKNGFYYYPRKKDLDDLSKIAKVKRQTFNEHLRRAENKLIPFITEDINL